MKKSKDAPATGVTIPRETELDALVKANKNKTPTGPEWDYRIALIVITVLAFITRFWGISHPNEVVFDEVHFGKVGSRKPVFSKTSSELTNSFNSSLHTTSSAHTFSMFIHRSESFFLL